MNRLLEVQWWWLSYASDKDGRNQGCVSVCAPTEAEAIARAIILDIAPLFEPGDSGEIATRPFTNLSAPPEFLVERYWSRWELSQRDDMVWG